MNVHTEVKPEIKLEKKRSGAGSMVFVLIAVFLLIALAFTVFTPLPVSYLARFAFRNGVAVPPENYAEIKEKTVDIKDLRYPSSYKDNLADIYLPKDAYGPHPVILWIHGGAFVGGDKHDLDVYATTLATEGYAVVCMNYRRAPEAKYPTPVIQTGEVYEWIKSVADEYHLDENNIVLAGDSAGAHIAAQFALVQTNPDYAAEMGIEPIVVAGAIKAMLLFCGPFDVAKIVESDNSVFAFLMDKTAWAYFGTQSWLETAEKQATISAHLTADFPPSFISDGNTGSFESHGRDLAEVLTSAGVPVDTYFIPSEIEVTKHEYQFIMNTPAGEESLKRTLNFLHKYVEGSKVAGGAEK